MRNSSIYRSNLSDEKIAFLSEIKNQKDTNQDSIEPKTYKRQGKQKELDLLWQAFKINPKEDKSPGVYLLTGFITGALCIFIMNAVISLSANTSHDNYSSAIDQPKYEKRISRKSQLQQVKVVPEEPKVVQEKEEVPAVETYIVSRGDTMSSIVNRFYGKYDKNKIEKIRKVNNLATASKLSIGQKLIIPLD